MSTSARAMRLSREKRSVEARMRPFSATMPLPLYTTSELDSPKPAEAYAYAQRRRADC